jgi:hypothetical protein
VGLPRGSSKTAREMLGGFLERSILGHDGDRRLAPVEPPVQAGAEDVVLETDLAWVQEGPAIDRTGIRRIKELRPAVIDIEKFALPRPAIAERILIARTDCPTRERSLVVRRSGGSKRGPTQSRRRPTTVTKNSHLSAAQPSLRRAVAIQRSVVWLTQGRLGALLLLFPPKKLKAWPSLLVAATSPSMPINHQPNWYWQPT